MMAWSYEFSSDKSLYEMEQIFNADGSWLWMVRDCAWYPDFLQAYPEAGVRLCIYKFGDAEASLYRALVEDASGSKRPALDSTLKKILEKLPALNAREVSAEPWPFD